MRATSVVARLATLLLFLGLVGISTYWLVQILAPRPAIAPAGSIGDSTAATNLAPSTLLFGRAGQSAKGPEAPPTNIEVNGIVEAGARGVAILTVDGKAPVAYAVNDAVGDATRLVAVTLDTVTVERNGSKIELKAPERASLSVLTSGVGKARDPRRDTTPPVPTRPVGAPGSAPVTMPGAAPQPGAGGVTPPPPNNPPGSAVARPPQVDPGQGMPNAGVPATPSIDPNTGRPVFGAIQPGQPAFPAPPAANPAPQSGQISAQPPGTRVAQ